MFCQCEAKNLSDESVAISLCQQLSPVSLGATAASLGFFAPSKNEHVQDEGVLTPTPIPVAVAVSSAVLQTRSLNLR